MTSLNEAQIRAAPAYNAVCDFYDDVANLFWARFGRRTIERLHLAPGAHMLDVCCGSGASAIVAAEAVGPSGTVPGFNPWERICDPQSLRRLFADCDIANAEVVAEADSHAIPFASLERNHTDFRKDRAMTYTGSCLCGGIRFRIDAELDAIQICHCTQCRKAQGGPVATNVPVAVTAFHLLSGDSLLKSFASSPGKERVFCSRCGSPVLSRRLSLPAIVRVRAGLLDEPMPARLAWHAHTASKCSWWPIDDTLPQYTEGYVPAGSA